MSDVKTYQMPKSDQEQRKKRSPNFYIQCKEKGMLDKDIASRMGIAPAQLSALRGRWDFIGKSLEQMKAKLKQETKKSYIKNQNTMKDDIKEDVEKAKEEKAEKQEDPQADYEKYMEELKQKLNDETGAKKALEDDMKRQEKASIYWQDKYDKLLERYHLLEDELLKLKDDQQPKQTVSEVNREIAYLVEQVESLKQETVKLQDERDTFLESFQNASQEYSTVSQKHFHLLEYVKLG